MQDSIDNAIIPPPASLKRALNPEDCVGSFRVPYKNLDSEEDKDVDKIFKELVKE